MNQKLPVPFPAVRDLIQALDLQAHPEGGFYRETWRLSRGQATPKDPILPQSALPAGYDGTRLPPVGYANGWYRYFISLTDWA